MPDVLLTDINGTLVDSNALHAEAWRRTFEHFGIQIGLDEAWSQIGKGGDQLIPVFVPEVDRERVEKPLKEFRKEIFHRDYMPRMVAFSQARELLLRVRNSGMKIALATSSEKADLAVDGKLMGWTIWWMKRLPALTPRRLSRTPISSQPPSKKWIWGPSRRLHLVTLRGMHRQQVSLAFP
jgi:phosphoglycolate phosphatase-like HAD superfamily hydrolase